MRITSHTCFTYSTVTKQTKQTKKKYLFFHDQVLYNRFNVKGNTRKKFSGTLVFTDLTGMKGNYIRSSHSEVLKKHG